MLNVDYEASILMLSGNFDEYLRMINRYYLKVKDNAVSCKDEIKLALESLRKQKKGFFSAKNVKKIIDGDQNLNELLIAKREVEDAIEIIRDSRDNFYQTSNYTGSEKLHNGSVFQKLILKEKELIESFEFSHKILTEKSASNQTKHTR